MLLLVCGCSVVTSVVDNVRFSTCKWERWHCESLCFFWYVVVVWLPQLWIMSDLALVSGRDGIVKACASFGMWL